MERFNRFISRRMPRWFNEWYAHACGYFWLPCDICGKMSGGHEWMADASSIRYSAYSGKGVCPECSAKYSDKELTDMVHGAGVYDRMQAEVGKLVEERE